MSARGPRHIYNNPHQRESAREVVESLYVQTNSFRNNQKLLNLLLERNVATLNKSFIVNIINKM